MNVEKEEVTINPTVLYLNPLQVKMSIYKVWICLIIIHLYAVYSGAQQKSCEKYSPVCDFKGEEMFNWILLYKVLHSGQISPTNQKAKEERNPYCV